ncbi:aldo/keto reductase [Micromonospora schwarzwaldensis]
MVLGLADLCRAAPPDLQARVDSLVAQAAAAGVTLIDTADAYAPRSGRFGLGEVVVRAAVRRLPAASRPVVLTKGGHTRPEGRWDTDGSFDYLLGACRASLRRLGRDSLDLYTLHRPDPKVDFAESLDALASIVAAGWARGIGLSNVSADQIRQGREALGESLVAVQNELSLVNPAGLAEVRVCAEFGLAFLAWAPLGGAGVARRLGEVVPETARLASAYSCTPQQVALAWLLAVGAQVVPVVGVNRPGSLRASVRATGIDMAASDVALLTEAVTGRASARP